MNKIFKRRDYSSIEAMLAALESYIQNSRGYGRTPQIDYNTDFYIVLRKHDNDNGSEEED